MEDECLLCHFESSTAGNVILYSNDYGHINYNFATRLLKNIRDDSFNVSIFFDVRLNRVWECRSLYMKG